MGKQIDSPIAKRGMFEGRKFRIDGKNEEDWGFVLLIPAGRVESKVGCQRSAAPG